MNFAVSWLFNLFKKPEVEVQFDFTPVEPALKKKPAVKKPVATKVAAKKTGAKKKTKAKK